MENCQKMRFKVKFYSCILHRVCSACWDRLLMIDSSVRICRSGSKLVWWMCVGGGLRSNLFDRGGGGCPLIGASLVQVTSLSNSFMSDDKMNSLFCHSHKKWRALQKKMKRKAKRQSEAAARDKLLQEGEVECGTSLETCQKNAEVIGQSWLRFETRGARCLRLGLGGQVLRGLKHFYSFLCELSHDFRSIQLKWQRVAKWTRLRSFMLGPCNLQIGVPWLG